jgi:glycosyltransferase involved in cell wall biosynthesis
MPATQTPGPAPAISLVVETANTRPDEYRDVFATLEALTAQSLPRDAFEILVVVNPDVHPTLAADVAAGAPHVRIIEERGSHFFPQKNIGAQHARADIVGFVDSDCLPGPQWAASVLDAFARNDDAMAAVQGPLTMEGGVLATAFRIRNFSHQQGGVERRIPSLAVCNCAIRRSDLLGDPFEAIPYFHGAEVRKVARLAQQGRYVLLVPGASCRHRFDPATLRYFLTRSVYWGYCFLELRRDAPPSVPHARFFQRIGPLAPLALAPAKALLDIRRLVQHRRYLDLNAPRLVACAAALVLSAVAVGWGAARWTLGRPAPKF